MQTKWRTWLQKTSTCCGADKHVDPENVLSLMCVSSDSQRQWREQRRGNRYNKSDDLLSELQTCVMDDVDSWYGRVIDVRSWMFDEGGCRRSSRGDTARCLMQVSWGQSSHWMQLDDRCGQLRSVELLKCGWTIVAGSWGKSSCWMQMEIVAWSWGRSNCWMQLDDRCG